MFRRATTFTLIHIALSCVVMLLAASWLTARAQPAPVRFPTQSTPRPTPDRREENVDFGAREIEARTRLSMKAEKKAYEEQLARAKEARDLAAELQKTYERARLFNAADYKKLERLEKLTRRIRNEVGGSGTDADPKEFPKTTDEAVTLLADKSKDLCEAVEKTPRRVISASIIDQANKLIALIQYVRGPRD